MTKQNFSSVHFLFILYVFNLLDVALLMSPPPPPGAPSGSSPKSIKYYSASANGELGVRFTFDPPANKAMHIIISYDTFAKPAHDFFLSQLTTAVLEKFIQCPTVTMFFLPCSTSKLDKGKLSCALGVHQCDYDRFHACVANFLSDRRVTLARFIICNFTGQSTEKCRADNQIDAPVIYRCIYNGDGDKQCDAFHTLIENDKKTNPNDHPPPGEKKQDATTDFVKVVCYYLAQANLQCDAGCT